MAAGLAQEMVDSPKLISATIKKTEFERKFQVICTDVLDGPVTVANAPGIPSRYSWYDFGNDGTVLWCRFTEVQAERGVVGPQGYQWFVTTRWETPDTTEDQNQNTDPLLEPPSANIGMAQKTYPMLGYWNGEGVVAWRNSAGEAFEHPPEIEISRIVLDIELNYPLEFDAVSLSLAYKDTTNSDIFWNCQPGKVKCKGITSQGCEKKLPDGSFFDYLRVKYTFEFTDDFANGWDVQLLDFGHYYLDSGGNKIAFQTADGHRTTGLLDGNGGQTNTPTWLPVRQRYKRVAFGALGLPQSQAACKLIFR